MARTRPAVLLIVAAISLAGALAVSTTFQLEIQVLQPPLALATMPCPQNVVSSVGSTATAK